MLLLALRIRISGPLSWRLWVATVGKQNFFLHYSRFFNGSQVSREPLGLLWTVSAVGDVHLMNLDSNIAQIFIRGGRNYFGGHVRLCSRTSTASRMA